MPFHAVNLRKSGGLGCYSVTYTKKYADLIAIVQKKQPDYTKRYIYKKFADLIAIAQKKHYIYKKYADLIAIA